MMIKRIVAFLFGGKLVWLQDHDGEVTLTIAYPSPFGGLLAKRHWPYNIHNVSLREDGSIDGGGCEYVARWKYFSPTRGRP